MVMVDADEQLIPFSMRNPLDVMTGSWIALFFSNFLRLVEEKLLLEAWLLFEELFYCYRLIMYAFFYHFASTHSKLMLVERLMVTVEDLLLLLMDDLLV